MHELWNILLLFHLALIMLAHFASITVLCGSLRGLSLLHYFRFQDHPFFLFGSRMGRILSNNHFVIQFKKRKKEKEKEASINAN